MAMYQRGESVVCSLKTRNTSGDLVNPDTSIRITVTDGSGINLVTSADMTNDGTGLYHFDFNSTTAHRVGRYRVRYVTVDAGRTTVVDEYFELEIP